MKKVLKFSASWCGPCKMLSNTLSDVKTDIVIESVDIDENADLPRQFNIRGVPTMVMLDGNDEVKRVSGALTKKQIEEWLNS